MLFPNAKAMQLFINGTMSNAMRLQVREVVLVEFRRWIQLLRRIVSISFRIVAKLTVGIHGQN